MSTTPKAERIEMIGGDEFEVAMVWEVPVVSTGPGGHFVTHYHFHERADRTAMKSTALIAGLFLSSIFACGILVGALFF